MIKSIDIGLVSADDAIVHFYRNVFDLEVLEPRVFPKITVYRLACASGVLKVAVPADRPQPPDRSGFMERAGLRYLTLWLDDLEETVKRWQAHGGSVAMAPTEIRPGVRIALLIDPDGNTVEAMCERAPARE